jgi:hypothetical protein
VPAERSWRTAVTQRTAVYAAFLAGIPQWVPLVLVAALVAAGLITGGPLGAVLLVVVAALAGWLAVLAWDHTPPAGRALRLLAVAAVLAVAGREALLG